MVELSVIIPVYNEQQVIKDVCKEIYDLLRKEKIINEIIVVNDGSTDKTREILDSVEGIKVLKNPYNLGYGASLKKGISAAKNELILMIDGDGTYPLEQLAEFLKYVDDFDIVSGARIGKDVKIPLLRRPAKFVLKQLAQFLVGMKLADINCGMRIIKKSNVMKYFNILPQKFSFTITHLLASLSSGETVKFVPINYHLRKSKSTIHPIKDFLRFNSIILRVITYFNPFKIFALISFSLFFLGIIIFIYSFFVLNKLMDITVIVIILSSIQIFLFGLLADLIVKKKL